MAANWQRSRTARACLLSWCLVATCVLGHGGISLDALSGQCRSRKQGGYVFEWCHELHVTQRHTDTPTLLGRFQRWRSHDSLAQTFGDGEACGDGTSKRRSATVRFSCCHGSEAPPPKQGAQGSTAAMKKE